MIAKSAVIHANVQLGTNVHIEDFCVIGAPVENQNDMTIIGDNAVIRSHCVIYSGNVIGNNFHCGNKANIREGNQIGHNVSIGALAVIEHHVSIEDNVRIHSQAFIPEYSQLLYGCWIGPNVVLTNSKYPNREDSKARLAAPVVHRESIIGANSTLLPGVRIGIGSIVGAGSLVNKDVQEKSVYAGHPARFIRFLDDNP